MCSKRSLKCSPTGALQIRQFPRFIGVGTRRQVRIHCSASPGLVQWYRLNKYNEDRNRAEEVKAGGRISVPKPGTKLFISALRVEDKGVYFCKVNDTWGPGTELQVSSKGPALRASSPTLASPLTCALPLPESANRMNAQYRTNMKDGLIIFQALLLAMCIAALMLRKHKLVRTEVTASITVRCHFTLKKAPNIFI